MPNCHFRVKENERVRELPHSNFVQWLHNEKSIRLIRLARHFQIPIKMINITFIVWNDFNYINCNESKCFCFRLVDTLDSKAVAVIFFSFLSYTQQSTTSDFNIQWDGLKSKMSKSKIHFILCCRNGQFTKSMCFVNEMYGTCVCM